MPLSSVFAVSRSTGLLQIEQLIVGLKADTVGRLGTFGWLGTSVISLYATGRLATGKITLRRPPSAASRYDSNHKQSNLLLVRKEQTMADLGAVLAQLKAERSRLDRAIEALSGVVGKSGGGGRTRSLSAAGRARIAAAQRARWAKFKRKKGS